MTAYQLHHGLYEELVGRAAFIGSLRAIGRELHRPNRVGVVPGSKCLALAGLKDRTCISQISLSPQVEAFTAAPEHMDTDADKLTNLPLLG